MPSVKSTTASSYTEEIEQRRRSACLPPIFSACPATVARAPSLPFTLSGFRNRASFVWFPSSGFEKAAAMWQQLGSVALEEGDINIAERCAAALGDVSRARFLRKVGVWG